MFKFVFIDGYLDFIYFSLITKRISKSFEQALNYNKIMDYCISIFKLYIFYQNNI